MPANRKKHRSRSEVYMINVKYLGEEPVFDLSKQLTQTEYSNALSWYNYMSTTEDAKEYTIEYLKFLDYNEEIAKFKKVPDVHVNMTAAWIARLVMRGYILPDSSVDFFWKKLNDSLKHSKHETAKIIDFNIQDRVKEKTDNLIGEIESLIDHNEKFDLYEFLKTNNTPPSYCASIIQKYSLWLQELLDVSDNSDEQLSEAYAYMTKNQINNKIMFINNLISDAEKYSNNVKKTRAPSKPKAVKVENVIRNFKFKKEDSNLKIASIKPEKIIGCQELWTYNTKYKTLTVFRAKSSKGLQIKGTSIFDYDEQNSMAKSTGRKHVEYINRVLKEGKISLKKLMNEITTANIFTNRTNENTILLKVS